MRRKKKSFIRTLGYIARFSFIHFQMGRGKEVNIIYGNIFVCISELRQKKTVEYSHKHNNPKWHPLKYHQVASHETIMNLNQYVY